MTTRFHYDLIGRINGITASDGQGMNFVYDAYNRLSLLKWALGNTALSSSYIYGGTETANQKPGLIYGVKLNGTQQIGYEYDKLARLKQRILDTTTPFVTEYTYHEGAGANTTTTLVRTVKNGNNTLEYAYDEVGNIISVKKNGTIIEAYSYDALNQLVSATYGGNTYTYAYDNGGNITEVRKNGVVLNSYTYGDADWKDLLTVFNGQTISYDDIGNPLNYRNGMSFTWQNGRQLASISQNGNALASYAYNADGLRTSKTVNGVETEYYWLNGTLYAQKTGDEFLYFLYDENGTAYGFILKNSSGQSYYYYEFNLQGDIIGIVDEAGTRVVEYTYGAWGNILSITGTLADSIGQKNPLRYRGYYYDAETGFYYVSSRYYDPEIGRFLNADGEMEGIGGDVLGYNLYAYCFNNPINMSDPTGNWPKWVTGVLNVVSGVAQMVAGAALGATVGWTGVGAVAAGFLIANGAGPATKGVAQIVNDVADKKVIREENPTRKIVEDVGGLVGGDTGKKLASTAYDGVTIAANIYAGATILNANMPKILNSPVFTQNNGYGIKLGKNIEMLYRNPNAAGGMGGTFFSYKGPLGKFRIDWDPTHGFHSHPPGH